VPPAGASKRSNPRVAAPSPVVACSLLRSIAVAIPLKTEITRAVSRDKKVHCLSLQLSEKPAASTHGFRTAAESAPANERAEQDGEESPDSPSRAENGEEGPHPPFSVLKMCVYLRDSDQLDSDSFSSIWGARRCCGAVRNPKSLNWATWSIWETLF